MLMWIFAKLVEKFLFLSKVCSFSVRTVSKLLEGKNSVRILRHLSKSICSFRIGMMVILVRGS